MAHRRFFVPAPAFLRVWCIASAYRQA